MRKGGVGRINADLGQDCHDRCEETDLTEFILHGALKKVADFRLGAGDADIKRKGVDFGCGALGSEKGGTDLRSVAVGNDTPPATLHHVNDAPCRRMGVGQLFIDCAALTCPEK